MEVLFIGTGEATDPSLANTSVLLRGSATVLIDCGYSVPQAFWRLCLDSEHLDAVYLTHPHADHSFGLPALLLWMRLAGRQRPLRVIGGRGAREWIWRVLEAGYEGAFEEGKCYPIEVEELEPGAVSRINRMELRNAESAHSIPNFSLRADDGAVAVAVSGDGAPSAASTALFRGVGLLVHECFRAEGLSPGHADVDAVLRVAEDGGVSAVALVHIMAEQRAAVGQRLAALGGDSTALRVFVPAPGDIWRPPAA